jgi:hypothetical protein
MDPSVSKVLSNIEKFARKEFDSEYKKALIKVINQLD